MKRIIFWDYERGTWQYDLMCMLIVAFIFLSPKAWFESPGRKATAPPPSAVKTADQLPRVQ